MLAQGRREALVTKIKWMLLRVQLAKKEETR